MKKKNKLKFSIVIPNWNGERLLRKNLPAVLATGADEVVIVDDGSTDRSVKLIKNLKLKIQSYNSKLKIIENKKNLGFVAAVNKGVTTAKGEIIVLLNNDVVPEKNFLEPLAEDFQDSKVFAVSLGEPQWSWAKGKWEKGFVEHEPGPKTKTPHISFWASGGSGAFRKDVWQKLGGFDPIFHPFYWEDVDLSYRAWKRGYKVIWDPRAVVYHKHEGTISRFPQNYVRLISERNRLLFIWKNITSTKMILEHKLWLAKKLLTSPGYWYPFLKALEKFPKVLGKRIVEIRETKMGDFDIFNYFR
ncbi:MAG: glycosyltransferase family 2 protein [Microgenomates group bacterium]